MQGKIPLISCLIATVLGISAGAWPEVRHHAFRPAGPTMKTRLAAAFADQQWATPKPGTWTPPAKSTDGLPPVITRIQTQEKVVFLTIDDGYEYDAEFVEILRKEKVPILTFLTSTYAKGHAEYFWALKNAGSQMENHTVSHPNMVTLSVEGQKREICESSEAVARLYGRRPQIFRPPFGSFNRTTQQVAQQCGIKSILLWSAEFYNGTRSPQGVPDAFVRGDGGSGFRPGDIILMHYRVGLAGQLRTMLGWLKQAGFRAACVQNYLPASLGGNAPG